MFRAIASLVGLALAGGCGPSPRMVHQNTEYFERCQAADYDSSVSAASRHACWSRWLAHYTHAQPKERIRHARGRVAALEAGEAVAPLPGMGDPALDDGRAPTDLTEPGDDAPGPATGAPAATDEAPKDAGAPRQQGDPGAPDASRRDAGAEARDGSADVSDEPPLRRPPRHRRTPCTEACLPAWERCARACGDRRDGCIRSCEAEHRICVAACP